MQSDYQPDLFALGTAVRLRRRALGLTQAELAGLVGCHQERISLIETGRYGLPNLPSLACLADCLNLALADLLTAAGYHVSAVPPDWSLVRKTVTSDAESSSAPLSIRSLQQARLTRSTTKGSVS